MNLLLILRCECACLVVLGFIAWYALKYLLDEDRRYFFKLIFCALGHTLFDFITVITVNRLDAVPQWANYALHIVFYLFAIMFCYELLCFVLHLIYEKSTARRVSRLALALPIIFAAVAPFLPIEYRVGRGTNYSFGPCVILGYVMAMGFFFVSEVLVIVHHRRLTENVKRSLMPSFVLMSVAVVAQVLVPELLYTGASVTLVTVGLFFAIANPAEKYRQRAYYDLTAGIKNRNCYSDDMARLDVAMGGRADSRSFACVLCDLNGLKEVNDTYGHDVGDEYIHLASKLLQQKLHTAHGIYRIGGDEFTAIYLDIPSEVVLDEVVKAQRICNRTKLKNGVPINIAFGVASAEPGDDIRAVVKRADQHMYDAKRAYYEMVGHDRRRRDANARAQ